MRESLLPFARPMNASEVLDAGFRLFRVTLPRSLPWSMLAVLLGQAPRALDLLRNTAAVTLSHKDPLWWGVAAAGGVLNLLLYALILLRQQTVAYATPRSLRGDLLQALRALPAFLLISLLGGLPMLLVGLAAVAGWWGMALALLVPALYLTVAVWFAAYLRLLQQRQPLAALADSIRLTRGWWWRTSGVLAVVLVVLLVLYALGAVVAIVLTQLFATADVALLSVVTTVVVVVVAAFFLPLLGAIGHTLFADLQLRRAAGRLIA